LHKLVNWLIIDWADKWQMDFNVSRPKYKVMHVGRTNPKKKIVYERKYVRRSLSRERFRDYYKFRFKVLTAMFVC